MDEAPAAARSDATVERQICFDSDYESKLIRITVEDGAKVKDFYIHKQLLFRKSDYFEAMANFKEGEKNHIILKDINHDAFCHISHWFYCGVLDDDINQDAEILIRTWIAADRLMLHECKNIAMDYLRRHHYDDPREESLRTAISLGCDKDHPMVRFLLDQISWECVHGIAIMDEFADTVEDMPQELVKPLMTRISKGARELRGSERSAWQKDRTDPASRKGCTYHEHVAGEECYTKNAKANGED